MNLQTSKDKPLTYYLEDGTPLTPDLIDARLKLYSQLLDYLCNKEEMPADPRFEAGQWIIETEKREKQWSATTPHVEIICWICRTFDDATAIPW